MQQKALKTLEYNKIIEQLEKHASSSLGRDLCRHLLPNADLEEVRHAQDETDQARTVYRLKGSVPLGGIFDIRGSMKRARIGGVLSATEWMEPARPLRMIALSSRLNRNIEVITAGSFMINPPRGKPCSLSLNLLCN